jgi:HEAT repeat protein
VIFLPDSLRFIVSLIAIASFALVQSFARLDQRAVFSLPLETTQQVSEDSNSEIARLTAQLKSSDEEERRNATVMLVALDTAAAIPALTAAANDPSERVRALAITGLAQLGDPSLVPIIAARLAQDKKPFVRKAAAYGLGKLHSNEGTLALVAALKDKDSEVRGAAAVALGDYADETAIAPLTQSLEDKSEFVRAQSARALGVNGRAARAAVPLLIRRLASDKDQEVKRQAATALGRIGEQSALSALKQAELDRDPYLSQAASEAIKMITEAGANNQGRRVESANDLAH